MRVVAVVSQKGGSGKSTIATEVAVVATQAGYRVRVLDLDPQATATLWGDARGGAEPTVLPAQHPRLKLMLDEAAAAGIDLVVIDTPPSADTPAHAAARVADLVLMPARPTAHDINAVGTSLKSVREIARRTPHVVVTQAQPGNVMTYQIEDALRAAEVDLCPVRHHFRAAYFKPLGAGRTAVEWEPASKAAGEVHALWSFVCGQVGLLETGPAHVSA